MLNLLSTFLLQFQVVLKFGGSSVSTKENWDCICEIIQQRLAQGFTVCVVHSALSGISDLLEQLIAAGSQQEATRLAAAIKQRHIVLGTSLGVDTEKLLRDYFVVLEHFTQNLQPTDEVTYRVQANILAHGELMSTKLGAAYLNGRGIETDWQDARKLMQSKRLELISKKRAYLNAECDYSPDETLQSNFKSLKPVVVTQGFIASNDKQETVTLGRGGSDTSAAYFGAKLQATRIEIWSDVPGMFSANPREISSARLLKNLTYREAQEIATNGAPVLHPKAIAPAQTYTIPIHLGYTRQPNMEGTVISISAPAESGSVKTIALRKNIYLVSMESVLMWQKVGFLADAFGVFKKHGLSVDLISTSESNVTASLDPVTNSHFNAIREEFINELSRYCKVEIIEKVSAISLLGRHIRTILHQLSDFFEVFREYKIYMVDQAVSDLNFTFVVDSEHVDRLVKELHKKLVTNAINQNVLGPSWAELMEVKPVQEKVVSSWWQENRDELIELGKEKSSAYVYSRGELQRNVNQIRSIDAITTYFYAMKANSNIEVIKTFYEAGLGFECVSINEINLVLELFPEIERKRILFTPNFAPRKEYELGFDLNVHLTVDNSYPLRHWPELFENKEIFLRIDPGYGMGHHKHVKTGGNESKFGIPQYEIDEVKQMVKNVGAKVVGLHAHTGSGIKSEMLWKNTAEILHKIAQKFDEVKYLDLGGGFGVQQFEMQSKLDLSVINRSLKEFKEKNPQYELWVEPGRFLTATAGVLLTTVTQLKGKGSVRYVGVETGMNSLIRPALYGAYHPIFNLSKLDDATLQTVNIVGPICESADKLGIDRHFPESEEGDIILVANAGAYGYAMSSNYNLRKPAQEFMIDE